MTLDAGGFLRRSLIHVLPDGFQRICCFGFLANCHRARKLTLCRELLAMRPVAPTMPDQHKDYRDRDEALTGVSLRMCPHCQIGRMLVVEVVARHMIRPLALDTS